MSTREAWRDLWRRGWSLLPLEARGKKARVPWKAYQEQRAEGTTVAEWLREWPDANPGVITGRVSGVIVLDRDGLQGQLSIKDRTMPQTPYVRTAKGEHYYFAYPQLQEGQRVQTSAGILPGIDSRGDGGYVVGPGAVHETGVIYEWGISPEEMPLADAPQWWLDLVVTSELDTRDSVPLYSVPGHVQREGDERARRYCEAALEGEADKVRASFDGEKHTRLLYSAIALGGFVPTLAEHEIEQALYDAIRDRAKDKHAARKTIRDGIDYGVRRPRPIPESDARPQRSRERAPLTPEQVQEVAEQQRGKWEPIPLSELEAADEAADWLWEGYVAKGMITILTGVWKGGKSTLLSHLLRAMGADTGTDFAGHAVRRSRVLVVSEESAYHWVGRRDELGIGNHVDMLCQPVQPGSGKREWEALIMHVAGLVGERGYDLVVLDSLHNLWAVSDENDNAQIRDALGWLRHITEQGAGIFMLAHPTKGDAPVGKLTRGGGAIGGYVDLLVEFHRMSADNLEDTRRLLYAMGRFRETPPELVLDYDPAWGYTPLGSKADAVRDARHAAILACLPDAEPGATVEDILADWPQNEPRPGKNTLSTDLGIMQASDITIVRAGTGRRDDPHRYWRSETNKQWQRRAS